MKKRCAVSFLFGLLFGGTVVYFVGIKLANRAAGIWECNVSQQEAEVFLNCLQVIDRGTTNDFNKFKLNGHTVLSNYIYRIQTLKNEDYFSMFTNSPTYRRAQTYLTNPPQVK